MTKPSPETLIFSWTTWMRAGGMSERTISTWPAIVLRAGLAAEADPAELGADQIAVYLASFTNANTKATYFKALRAWHGWLVLAGHRADDPTTRLRRPRPPRGVPHPISTAGLHRLLGATTGRVHAMVALGAFQGLRVHEIAKIRGEDFDLDSGVLRVVGKGGVAASLPLHPEVARIAEAMPRRGWWFVSAMAAGKPIQPRTVTTHIAAAMRRAEVNGVPHGLRHWHATNLLREGADIRTVQTLMRHASLATTEGYLEVDSDARRAAVLRLPSRAPGGLQERAGDAEVVELRPRPDWLHDPIVWPAPTAEDYAGLDCPAWCDGTDHQILDGCFQGNAHAAVLGDLVGVIRDGDGPTEVFMPSSADLVERMTPAQARALAAELLRAAEVAEGDHPAENVS